MSATPTVEEAKRQLRQARLAEHKKNIGRYLANGNDKELSKVCSSFKAMFESKKPKSTS